MVRRLLSAAAGGGLMAALVACSSSAPESTTPEDAGDDDATSPVEAGLVDADRDATPDAAVSEAGATYCALLAPRTSFCEDFDDGIIDFGSDGWDILTDLNGTAALSTDAKSPPFALTTKSIGLAGGEGARVHLRASRPGSFSRATLAFSAFLPKVAFARGQIGVASLDVANNHFFTLFLRDDDEGAPGPTLEESAAVTTRHVLSGSPPANAWTRITIDLDFTTSKASVSFDGTKVLDGATIQPGTGAEITFRIGAAYVDGPADPFEARFDDVVLDF